MFFIFLVVSLVSLRPLRALCITELWTRRGMNSAYRTGWSRYDTLLFIGKAEKPASRSESLPHKGSLFHLLLSEIVCVQGGGWLAYRYGAIAYVSSSTPLDSTI